MAKKRGETIMSIATLLKATAFSACMTAATAAMALTPAESDRQCGVNAVCTAHDSKGNCTNYRCKTPSELAKEKKQAEEAKKKCDEEVAEANKKAGGKSRAVLECER